MSKQYSSGHNFKDSKEVLSPGGEVQWAKGEIGGGDFSCFSILISDTGFVWLMLGKIFYRVFIHQGSILALLY